MTLKKTSLMINVVNITIGINVLFGIYTYVWNNLPTNDFN